MATCRNRVLRRGVLAGLAAAALAVPTPSFGAPGWTPPVQVTLPKAGTPMITYGITLATGTGGRASLLYGAEDGALWTVSRPSARARLTPRRWRADARVSETSPIAAVLGTRLTALWTTRDGGVATASGGLVSAGRPTRILSGSRAASPSLSLTPAGLAYAFVAGRYSPEVFGGLSPVGTPPLRAAARIDATTSRFTAEIGADSAGNMTAAWIGPTGQLQVATKPASAIEWSAPTALPGWTRGAFDLAVAPSGAAAIVYAANAVYSPRPSGSGTYLARTEVLLAQRLPGETAFGAPQVAGVFTQDPPRTRREEYVGDWPTAATVAVNDTTVVLGFVGEGLDEKPAGFYVSRAALGAPLPSPTRLTNPRLRGLSGLSSWDLWGVDVAIDRNGAAAFAVGGNPRPGVTDSVFATTSTTESPGWTRMTDIALCDSRAVGGTGIVGLDLAAPPSGGLTAAWVCIGDGFDAIGMATFPSGTAGAGTKATRTLNLSEGPGR